jgi:paraquat-inducible protein B
VSLFVCPKPVCNNDPMAELTYNDVRRAAGEAVRELQSIVNGLKINSDGIRRDVQQTSGSQNRIMEINGRLDTLQNQVNSLDRTMRNQLASGLVQEIHQHMSDMHQRLVAAEELIRYMYNYFSVQQQLQRRRERGEF